MSQLAYQWFEQEPLILNVLSFLHPQNVFFNTVACKGEKKDYRFAPLWEVNKLWYELLFSERFCKLYFVNCLCRGKDTVQPFLPEACEVTKAKPKKRIYGIYDDSDSDFDSDYESDYYGYDTFNDSDSESESGREKREYNDDHLVLKSTDESRADYYVMSGQSNPREEFNNHLKENAGDQRALNQIAMRAIRRGFLFVYPNLNFKDNFFQLMSILRGALVLYEGYNFKVNTKLEKILSSFRQYFPGGDLHPLDIELNEPDIIPIQKSELKSELMGHISRCLQYVPFYQVREVYQNLKKVNLYNMFRNPKEYIFGSIYHYVIVFKDDGNALFYGNGEYPNRYTLLNGLITVYYDGSALYYKDTYFSNEKEMTPDISLMLQDMFEVMSNMYESVKNIKIRSFDPPEKTAYNYYTNIMKPKLIRENPDKPRKEIVSMISKMWKQTSEVEKNDYKKQLEKKKQDYYLNITQQNNVAIRGLHNTEPPPVQMKRFRESDVIPIRNMYDLEMFGIGNPYKFRKV